MVVPRIVTKFGICLNSEFSIPTGGRDPDLLCLLLTPLLLREMHVRGTYRRLYVIRTAREQIARHWKLVIS